MEALGIVIIILSAPGIIFFIFIWIFIQYTRLFNKEKYKEMIDEGYNAEKSLRRTINE